MVELLSAKLDHPFIDVWKDCDPELRPMVDLARQRLAGLVPGTKPASLR